MEKEKNFLEEMNELENINSHIDKEEALIDIVKTYPEAERFLRLTFNDKVYGIKELSFYNAYDREFHLSYPVSANCLHASDWLFGTPYEPREDTNSCDITDLEYFSDMMVWMSGTDQLLKIREFFDILEQNKKKWYSRAILKELRCGVQVKTVNKVFKSLGLKKIDKFSMQLCDKLNVMDEEAVNKKITFPCVMELKEDGIRIQADIQTKPGTIPGETIDEEDIKVSLISRRGKDRTELYPEIVKALRHAFAGENIILDGEIKAASFQKLTRKDDTSQRRFVVFDILNQEELPYKDRWNNLVNLFNIHDLPINTSYNQSFTDYIDNQIINNKCNSEATVSTPSSAIQLIEHYSANNIEELQDYYGELIKRKEEGMIIKLEDRPYERGSRKHMFKCKKVHTADLEIIGWNYGEGKKAGMVGSLQLRDLSGTITVDVGSGITDDMCEELTNQMKYTIDEALHDAPEFIGKICEILYNEITETKSIRFPRFVCIRDDKDEPDDLSEVDFR